MKSKFDLTGYRGVIKKCPNCKRDYRARTYSVYCSRACRNKANPPKFTEEHREKLSKSLKGKNAGKNNPAYGKFGEDSWTYGTKRTDRVKRLMSALKKGKYTKELNPNWKGGKSFELYPEEFNKELKTKIRKRDKFVCQLCGLNGYDVHHIDYNKMNCTEQNLITLCRRCHPKTNHNRERWMNILKNMVIRNE